MVNFVKYNHLCDDEAIDDVTERLWKFSDFSWGYNMVGVAVAVGISTMHDKSCIDLHNARQFVKGWKI